jgi:hypothetical protein
MQELVDKLKVVEEKLSREHGPFDLFAVLERADLPGRYDVVVAAPWLPKDPARAIYFMFDAFESTLVTDDLLLIARVVPLQGNEDVTEQIRKAFADSPRGKIDRAQFGNVRIRSGVALQA